MLGASRPTVITPFAWMYSIVSAVGAGQPGPDRVTMASNAYDRPSGHAR